MARGLVVFFVLTTVGAFRRTSTHGAARRGLDDIVRHPVVVVGPLLGQTLEVNDKRWFNLCSPLRSKWKTAWFTMNPKDLLCGLTEQLFLTWDETTNLTSSPAHVEVRVADGWDGLKFSSVDVYGNLTNKLLEQGYVKDFDLLPQPYDWRLGVADWREGAYPKMQKLIEQATTRTGKKVVLTGISMAGPFTHGFLSWIKEVDPSWSDKFVHAWVPVGAPWNGAVNALSALVGGALLSFSSPAKAFDEATFLCPDCKPALGEGDISTNVTSGFFHHLLEELGQALEQKVENHITNLIRTMPSMYWMSTGVDHSTTPSTDQHFVTLKHALWSSENEVEEKVTASRMPSVFRRMGKEKEAKLLEYAMSVGTTTDPGVPVHCVYAHNVRTFTHLNFPTSDFSSGASIVIGNGDGTVHLEGSLDVCDRWPSTQKSYRVPGVAHVQMMTVGQVLDVIVAVATEQNEIWESWQPPAFDELELLAGNSTSLEVNLLEKFEG